MRCRQINQAEKLLAASTNGASADSLRARAEAAEIIRRTRIQYSLDADGLLAKVRKSVPDATAADVERWARESKVRFHEIDGTKFYFSREPQNFLSSVKKPSNAAQKRATLRSQNGSSLIICKPSWMTRSARETSRCSRSITRSRTR
ncbi:MAG: hypothetical protein WDM80_02155 [Limisphaerales bacterium]